MISPYNPITPLSFRVAASGAPAIDADYAAVLARAIALGDTHPSPEEKLVAEQVMIMLKAASTNELASWSLLRFWATNKDYAGSVPANLGYTGVNWAAPANNESARINTITQVAKKGYHGNGTDAAVLESWNPSTSGLVKTDFLWFTVAFMNGLSGQGYMESLFNGSFDSSMQIQYPNNSGDNTGGRIFSREVPSAVRLGQLDAPTFQRMIMKRVGDEVYFKINGSDNGPYLVGADTAMVNDNFFSLCRSYVTGNRFDYLGDNIIKTCFGFGKASEIDDAALDAALEYYIDNI